MERKLRRDARFAAAFAALVCAWALVFVALGLAGPLRDTANARVPDSVVTAGAR